MAIAPTGAIYKALKFDNVSSRTYGVYITGEAVYNAPERDVEMITIPGRSGSFALDNGRFENIEVSYPAGIFADTETDFRQAISDFRNFLCSRKGYVRLTDEYNPDEYRMAVYKSGLDVSPAQLQAGEFEITFECKPQRYLSSGETKSAITSGNTLTNPTLFESGPLFEVKGYGTIDFNGFEIELTNETVGDVHLADSAVYKSKEKSGVFSYGIEFSTTNFNSGDTITVSPTVINEGLSNVVGTPEAGYILDFKTLSVSSESGATAQATIGEYTDGRPASSSIARVVISVPAITFSVGTSSTHTVTIDLAGSVWNEGLQSMEHSYTAQIGYTFAYDGDGAITVTSSFTCTTQNGNRYFNVNGIVVDQGETQGVSTLSMLGDPTYIDCDLGEAYMIIGTEVFSLNKYIDLGSDLPKLGPGANTVTYDNTITELKVTPRWWKV